jgi:hypothetical protein
MPMIVLVLRPSLDVMSCGVCVDVGNGRVEVDGDVVPMDTREDKEVERRGVEDVSAPVCESVGANSNEIVEISILVRMRVDEGGDEEGVSVERIGGLDGCSGRERGIVNLKSVEVVVGLAEKLSMVIVGGDE